MLLIEGFLVGGCAGLVAIVYRRLLSWAEEAVMWISTQLRADLLWLPLVLVMLVLIGVGIAALLRWEPMISGSGIPQIEGEVQGTIDQNWKRVIPCKMRSAVCHWGGKAPASSWAACAEKGWQRCFTGSHMHVR